MHYRAYFADDSALEYPRPWSMTSLKPRATPTSRPSGARS
jgi:hypothetical protein